ncbi:MAG TPA: bifunctional shikimate kinase/3-dehydroquinate synthase [Gaiellaceae bacterium]
MGAGKSTLGAELAERVGRRFADLDRELEARSGRSIAELYDAGEAAFRRQEAELTCELLERREPLVLALGGGAVSAAQVRACLRERALTLLVKVDVDEAWARVRDSGRPLARDQAAFQSLYAERLPLYRQVADAAVRDGDDAVLAAGGIELEPGAIARLAELSPQQVELVSDERVLELHRPPLDVPIHVLRQGEQAKTAGSVERLWRELRLDRSGTLVALGGGCVTDVAGFAAATYLRGIDWLPVPTTLVGQVDAAIGGKTAINLPEAKNLVGAFHWPSRTLIDPELLRTLPDKERREGMAEVVKTGLLAGQALWELPEEELVRSCAAFKTALCLRDPDDRGPRQLLNLGHTFAHALEAAADYDSVSHGQAVALGLLAALRLSGRPQDAVRELLAPRPVRADRERAWQALQRDKKSSGGELTLVLLGAEGAYTAPVPAPEVRRALDELIAD